MPDDIGALLRDARERAGVSLRDIATETKISMPTLEALERNDVARLPGGIFLRAFVRAYAKEVGLDPEDVVRRFVARFPDAAVEEDATPTYQPIADRHVLDEDRPAGRVWRIVGWSLPLVLVIVYFGFGGRLSWVREQLRPAAPRVEVQPEPAPPAPSTPVMTAPVAAPLQDASAQPAPGSGTGATGAGGVDAAVDAAGRPGDPQRAAGAALPPQVAVPPVVEAARQPETITSPATEGRFTMSLAPRARCWVTVRSNGKILYAGTMNPGDRQNLVLGGNVSLTVGNAGVMAFEIDGKPGKSLGAEGQVVTALLNAQNLKTFIETR
jgi:cytoskeleton protein RodZ